MGNFSLCLYFVSAISNIGTVPINYNAANLDNKFSWLGLCLILLIACLSRFPAITNELQSYPGDTTKWAAPAVNFADHGFREVVLPRIDQGNYAELAGNYYYRWPLLPFYAYGAWATAFTTDTTVLRLAPLLLNLITTIYVFMIGLMVFRQKPWALIATALFAFIPGHFYMSVQIADTQFWLLTLVGGTYHKFRYEQGGNRCHLAIHLLLLVIGCFCSWFGYLSLAGFYCTELFLGRRTNRWSGIRGFGRALIEPYGLILLGIVVVTLPGQIIILYLLAGDTGINSIYGRFHYWVANTRPSTKELNIIFRMLGKTPDTLVHIWEIHLPRVFGSAFVGAFIAGVLTVALFFRKQLKDNSDAELIARLVMIYGIVVAGYIILFARHAARAAHSFTYQQLSPVLAIVMVAVIASMAGRFFSGRLRYLATVLVIAGLVLPAFSKYYFADHLNEEDRASKVEAARQFGAIVNQNTKPSDLTITNKNNFGYDTNIAKYTSRRTLIFKKNLQDFVQPYIDRADITGIVYIHWLDTQNRFNIDESLAKTLDSSNIIFSSSGKYDIYRLR